MTMAMVTTWRSALARRRVVRAWAWLVKQRVNMMLRGLRGAGGELFFGGQQEWRLAGVYIAASAVLTATIMPGVGQNNGAAG